MTEKERRAFNRGVEEAAKVADLYADENMRMCHDSLLHDPVLAGRQVTAAAVHKSKKLAVRGHMHSSMYHAATNIAAAVRDLKVKPSSKEPA